MGAHILRAVYLWSDHSGRILIPNIGLTLEEIRMTMIIFSLFLIKTTYRWLARSLYPPCLDWTSACSGINWRKTQKIRPRNWINNWLTIMFSGLRRDCRLSGSDECWNSTGNFSDSKCNHGQQSLLTASVCHLPVSQTQRHGADLPGRKSGDEALHLTPDASHQLSHSRTVDAAHVQLFL